MEEDLEEDLDLEYNENDWEELESDNAPKEESEKNEQEPETFLMKIRWYQYMPE